MQIHGKKFRILADPETQLCPGETLSRKFLAELCYFVIIACIRLGSGNSEEWVMVKENFVPVPYATKTKVLNRTVPVH